MLENTIVVFFVLVLNFIHEDHELGFYPFAGNGRVPENQCDITLKSFLIYTQATQDCTLSLVWLILVSHS